MTNAIEIAVSHQLGAFRLAADFTSDGRLTALFGRSGSGKTSLVNIIAGLIRPERGRIAIDGQVLLDSERGIFVPKHRRRIGYVFQEARLFPHLTVRQNLLYGQWFAPKADVGSNIGDVLDLLGIGHLLQRHPGRLSGGEKQRVAIARAILKNPRILIFDEATSSLDTHSEQVILDALGAVAANHTTLVIAHRLSTVIDADTLLVMDQGRIVERGSHQALLAKDGIYSRLWALQQEERAAEDDTELEVLGT